MPVFHDTYDYFSVDKSKTPISPKKKNHPIFYFICMYNPQHTEYYRSCVCNYNYLEWYHMYYVQYVCIISIYINSLNSKIYDKIWKVAQMNGNVTIVYCH